MITKMNTVKVYFALVICCFISTVAWAQQNVIGIEGNSGDLIGVEMAPVSYVDGLRMANGDNFLNFNMSSLYEMHQLNFRELNNTVFGSLRFDGSKIYVSTLGNQEHLINITVHKNYNHATGEDGAATLYFEGGDSLNIEFSNILDPNVKVWIFRFFIPEQQAENEFYDILTAKEKEIEKENKPINGFYVSVHYSIK
jgi:hypothetical protein